MTEQIALDATTPPDIENLYNELATAFSIDPTAPPAYAPPSKTRFLKMLMPSYLEASGFDRPRTDFAVTDDRYICALADGERPTKRPPKPPAPPKWDSVLAMALRQPMLAERLGLIYVTSLELTDLAFYENGGWLFVTLDSASDYFGATVAPDFLKVYAARIPPLAEDVSAPVFAPVLFPVTATPSAGSFDEIFREADTYVDGFARLVHTFQPDRADYLGISRQDDRGPSPFQECGIKLGWDDEQIVIWLNRQLTDDPRNNSPIARDTPLGVRGFRVDVRDADGPGPWVSLVRMQGQLQVGALPIGAFDGEMAIELAPSQLQGKRDGEYWLPPYFTQWTGSSLIAADETAFKLTNNAPSPRVLNPVGAEAVPLRYGKSYHFRVRLTDIAGGGPLPDAEDEPPSGIAPCNFRRYLPPGTAHIDEPVENADGTLTFSIGRPVLGYPALVYTGLSNAEDLLLQDAAPAAAEGRLPGFPDPDVTMLRIDVTVGSLEFDPGNQAGSPEPRRLLYSTFRGFPNDPGDPLDLILEFRDEPDLASFPPPVANGPLKVPTARGVALTFTPVARQDPAFPTDLADPALAEVLDQAALDKRDPKLSYFGKHAARIGTPHTVSVRRESRDESELFQEIPGVPFQAMFLRPDPAPDVLLSGASAASGTQDQAPENAPQRLARQLRLDVQDITFGGQAGRRVVFGASAALRHVLSPDHSTISFATKTEITSQWVVAIPLCLARDWTWDALLDEGFEVFRSIDGAPWEFIGTISPRRALSATAVRRDVPLQRSATDLYFFDAIDPKPVVGRFPSEITVAYSVVPRFREDPDSPLPSWEEEIFLPIAAPPSQVPRLVSAGIALSPYRHDEKYSSTEPRRRMLWLEFAEPVANPRDACFGRVLMHAPDPMLTDAEPAPPPGPLEPPLNLDPEHVRSIIPGQPADASGLDAMQRLIPADGPDPATHFLLPLPPASPRLRRSFSASSFTSSASGMPRVGRRPRPASVYRCALPESSIRLLCSRAASPGRPNTLR